MTVLIKYPRQNEESNKKFFERKEKELSNLDWAKWGGWFDSDGSFSYSKRKQLKCDLTLYDKSPVELFSKTFEVSLKIRTKSNPYEKSVNKIPNVKFSATITSEKAVWFCKKIHPFIINKNNKLNKILNIFNINLSQNYNNMVTEEFVSWLTSFIEGDGSFTHVAKKYPVMRITSNNNYLLNYIKDKCNKENLISFGKITLKQKAGRFKLSSKSNLFANRKNGYIMSAGRKDNLVPFYNKILPKMTLDRKKQIIFNHFELFKNVK